MNERRFTNWGFAEQHGYDVGYHDGFLDAMESMRPTFQAAAALRPVEIAFELTPEQWEQFTKRPGMTPLTKEQT